MPYETSVPFRAGSEGYASFRIPACVLAPDGTLLAFAEGRVDSSGDTGHIDIVARRSADGGRSWGELRVVASHGTGTAGNPSPVVIPPGEGEGEGDAEEPEGTGGRIVLVFVTNAADATEDRIRRGEVSAGDGRRVWVQHSTDSGESWSGPREITPSAKMPDWRWYATTPGHALRLTRSPHEGRLVVPANHSLPPEDEGDDGTEGRYNGGHDLLSDDGGETWRIGYTDDNTDGVVNVNETTAAELPDGVVYFNTRTEAIAPEHRADARSEDGGESLLAPFEPQPALTAPVVEASVLQLYEPDVLVFSAPGDPEERRRMTLRASFDGGTDWWTVHTVDDRPAAYSDLVRVDDGTLGLLYETGDENPYETVTFRRVPVAELASVPEAPQVP
ncbi:alpha-sialidase [Streptomyces abyssalis]|uniref:exo-alpha-sialidase n=1 Tax=Streptomyces abyssalis TaxID=933944 RepID=A0A1E7JKH7_9ACTN|nr:sialidase family protein [Streptomyces abyssalis]OEU88143.1 alpha-sialidase [Streptomyces abyssalis]OEU91014.1 alpha-sialidase [Streptomyces abyssalis]OEV28797.1 alpha-sialidase [Streptomyces nanshensis]